MSKIATSKQAGPLWPLIVGEEEFNQITSGMLSSTIPPGNSVETLWHWIAIAYGKWTPVGPRDKQRCCTGEITKLTICGDGDISVYLKPSAECGEDCAELLAPGGEQTELVCELPWASREPFTDILPKLAKGMCIEICGYHVRDGGHGGQYELHTITSIDPYP